MKIDFAGHQPVPEERNSPAITLVDKNIPSTSAWTYSIGNTVARTVGRTWAPFPLAQTPSPLPRWVDVWRVGASPSDGEMAYSPNLFPELFEQRVRESTMHFRAGMIVAEHRAICSSDIPPANSVEAR